MGGAIKNRQKRKHFGKKVSSRKENIKVVKAEGG